MIVDIVVLGVALLSSIIAFLRGFIREVLTILGVVGGILAAIFASPKLVPMTRSWLGVTEDGEPQKLLDLVPMSLIADVSTYAAIFIVVVMVLSVVSHFVAGAAKAMGLGAIDRTLGVIFGIVRAVVLLGLLYLPFHLLMDQETKEKFFAESKTHIYIEKTAEVLAGFLPEGDKEVPPQEDAKIQNKLKELDLLRQDKPLEDKTDKKAAPGYNKSERQQLEQLFEGNE